MRSGISGVALCLALVPLGLQAQEAPRDRPAEIDYREETRVDLAQIEVTVWPKKDDDAALCQGLTLDDFWLTVNGRNREIVAVDWLGSEEAMEAIEGEPIADPSRPPLTMVLFFDLWHLNVFFRQYTCPVTKPLAFDQARELVREEFRAGDRLLIVTFAGWPQIHEGWIRDPEHALRVLDRVEVNPLVMQPWQVHSHHQEWIRGVKSLLLALGHYPGRKEIFYLGDDFRFDDVALQTYDLAARAQASRVTMHAVDLLSSCRNVPGPGCAPSGGLGCTEWRIPIALGYVSVNTGGQVYKHGETLATAARKVRAMRGCRYLISFPMTRRDRKHSPRAAVHLDRKDLRLHFPSSYSSPKREATERERQNALFLLPRFGEGLYAEVGLWPLRPSGKRNRWKGLAVARLSRTKDDSWPEGLEKIEIELVAHKQSTVHGNFRKVLEGEELAQFRETGEARLMVFPLNKIPPGENTVSLRALGVGGDVSANVRSILTVPDPPGPGETGPWFIADRVGRLGDTLTVLPVLDGEIAADREALIVGYGCPAEPSGIGEGRLIALDSDAIAPVAIDWLSPPGLDSASTAASGCGWLAGSVSTSLAAGLWRFEPPESLTPDDAQVSTIEFRVADPD